MTDKVDHGAHIAKMIGDRDSQIFQLKTLVHETTGENLDLSAELELAYSTLRTERLAARKTERCLRSDINLRDDRIREVVGFCNEETQAKAALVAELETVKRTQEQANPLPFALHMIMCAGISHYHTIIMQLAQGTANRRTNKVTRELAELNDTQTVGKQPSLYRSIAMYCSAASASVPTIDVLRAHIKGHVESHVELFMKDPQFKMSRAMLHLVWEADNKAAHMGFGARNICKAFDWLPACIVKSTDVLEDDDDYEELFCESVLMICMGLIHNNFL